MKGLLVAIFGTLLCASAITAMPDYSYLYRYSILQNLVRDIEALGNLDMRVDFVGKLDAAKCFVATSDEFVVGTQIEKEWPQVKEECNEAIADIEQCAQLDNEDDQQKCASKPGFKFIARYALISNKLDFEDSELSKKFDKILQEKCGVEKLTMFGSLVQ